MFDPNKPFETLDKTPTSGGFDPSQPFESVDAAPTSAPLSGADKWKALLSQGAQSTPFGGMANAISKTSGFLSKPFLPVPDFVRKGASYVTAATTRPARALGVAAAEGLQAQPGFGLLPFNVPNAPKLFRDAKAAYQPDFVPQTPAQVIGSNVGENAALVGLGGIGGALPVAAMAANNAEREGKLSAMDLLAAGGLAAHGATKLFKSSGLAEKALPPLMKAAKGTPIEVTKMAIRDPGIMDLPGSSESIQGKSQDIINAIKEAHRKVGDQYSQAYESHGMKGPMQEIIDTPIAQKINPILEEVPSYQKLIPTEQRNPATGVTNTRLTPGDVVTEKKVTGFRPGRLMTVRDSGPSFDQLLIDKNLAEQAFQKGDQQAFSNLYKKYVGNQSSNLKALKVGPNDQLEILTEIKRALQNKANYPAPGQQLTPTQGAENAAIKRMAGEIDRLRGTIPGGGRLSIADDAYHEMQELNHRLMTAFKDPYTGQDYLNRILKGNTDWLTSGRMQGKIGAIERIEQITGKQVLKPALREMAAAYLNNPDILGLPSTRLSSLISYFIPTKSLISGAIGRSGKAVAEVSHTAGHQGHGEQTAGKPGVYTMPLFQQIDQKPLFRKAS